MKFRMTYCPTAKTRINIVNRVISESPDPIPPAEVTILTIDVSTTIATVAKIITMKTLILPNLRIIKMYSLHHSELLQVRGIINVNPSYQSFGSYQVTLLCHSFSAYHVSSSFAVVLLRGANS